MTNMWMVRAGKNAIHINDFEKLNIVAIGWGLGDLTNKTPDEIKELVYNHFPNNANRRNGMIAANEIKFRHEIKEEDYVLSVNSWNHYYLLGKVTSDYYFDPSLINDEFSDVRNVEWLCKIPKDNLKESTQNTLGSRLTVYSINDEASEDILSNIGFERDNKWDHLDKGKLTDLGSTDVEPFESKLKRNLIYFGAPGTGKSYYLNLDKDELLKEFKDNYERVTFHPDYSYANFVGTYKPVPDGDSITYDYVPGPFMRILKKALNKPDEPFMLIIEEINRANVAAVFGDVFQLLDRDENYDSEYSIETSEDMRRYLNRDKIKLPQNLFIWATMNSADQGVFPMDTAFKRRWDFKYFSINHNENLIKDTHVIINDKQIYWNDLRKRINDELLSYNINEDKLIGPFFAFTKSMNEEIEIDSFKDIFKNKIIMYLFEDAARSRRNQLFSGACNIKDTKNITYFELCELIDEDKITEIFSNDFLEDNDNE